MNSEGCFINKVIRIGFNFFPFQCYNIPFLFPKRRFESCNQPVGDVSSDCLKETFARNKYNNEDIHEWYENYMPFDMVKVYKILLPPVTKIL